MRKIALLAALALVPLALALAQDRTAAPAGAEAYIISPTDGATVKRPGGGALRPEGHGRRARPA